MLPTSKVYTDQSAAGTLKRAARVWPVEVDLDELHRQAQKSKGPLMPQQRGAMRVKEAEVVLKEVYGLDAAPRKVLDAIQTKMEYEVVLEKLRKLNPKVWERVKNEDPLDHERREIVREHQKAAVLLAVFLSHHPEYQGQSARLTQLIHNAPTYDDGSGATLSQMVTYLEKELGLDVVDKIHEYAGKARRKKAEATAVSAER